MNQIEMTKDEILNLFRELDDLTEKDVSMILLYEDVNVWLPQTKKEKERINEIIDWLKKNKLIQCSVVQKKPEGPHYLEIMSTEKLRNKIKKS